MALDVSRTKFQPFSVELSGFWSQAQDFEWPLRWLRRRLVVACLEQPLIDFLFHLRPGKRYASSSEVGVTTGEDVVLLAPYRTEAECTDQVFTVLVRCNEARACPTCLGRCFVSTHVHIDGQPILQCKHPCLRVGHRNVHCVVVCDCCRQATCYNFTTSSLHAMATTQDAIRVISIWICFNDALFWTLANGLYFSNTVHFGHKSLLLIHIDADNSPSLCYLQSHRLIIAYFFIIDHLRQALWSAWGESCTCAASVQKELVCCMSSEEARIKLSYKRLDMWGYPVLLF